MEVFNLIKWKKNREKLNFQPSDILKIEDSSINRNILKTRSSSVVFPLQEQDISLIDAMAALLFKLGKCVPWE